MTSRSRKPFDFLASLIGMLALAFLLSNADALMGQASADDQLLMDQQAKMEKLRREEALKKLKEETAKFYQAAGELKELIEKTSPHTFSLQIVKKTEEIEKMLKEIRRKAKEGIN